MSASELSSAARSASPATPGVMPAEPLASGARLLKSPHKGQQTKAAIVDVALGLASRIGLEGLSIGAVAELMHMSKSGVFAHFGSRDELQISVVRDYFTRFEKEVFHPALSAPAGLPRLQALFDNWMTLVAVELQSGCIFISGAVEFDDRPGPVRDALASSVQVWLDAMCRAVVLARDIGHLRSDTDERQMAFEIHGLILALHYEARFLKNPGSIDRALRAFASILARYAGDSLPTRKRARASTALPKKIPRSLLSKSVSSPKD